SSSIEIVKHFNNVSLRTTDILNWIIKGAKLIISYIPLISIALPFLMAISSNYYTKLFDTLFTTYEQAFSNLDSVETLIFGNGVQTSTSRDPLVINVIESQGLLGIAAYVLLFAFFIYALKKIYLHKSISSGL